MILKIYYAIVLTDSDFKSSIAYQLLKECIKELYNHYSDSDVDNVSNLNKCRESIANIINGNGNGPYSTVNDIRKNDKMSKA